MGRTTGFAGPTGNVPADVERRGRGAARNPTIDLGRLIKIRIQKEAGVACDRGRTECVRASIPSPRVVVPMVLFRS